ncbi:MAG: hypothetical protein ABF966_00020 [Bifidobacterium psychraerophilum]|uniref:HNH endonuclease n=1 Tax=Bifidobacterium psychraerophilum TaxID=218140 RepID=UPI0039ED0112
MSEPSRKTCALVDARDGEACVRCGRSLWSARGSRHHRKPRSVAGLAERHTTANLILLCGSGTTGCHGWVHAHISEAVEHGWLIRSFGDPKQVPVDTVRYGRVYLDEQGRASTFNGGRAEEGTDIEQRRRSREFMGGEGVELVQG